MRRRMMLGCKSELPSGYKRCEYLESTGTQYIDTLLLLEDLITKTIHIDFQLLDDLSTKNTRIFGMYDKKSISGGFFQFFTNHDVETYGFQYSSIQLSLANKNNNRHYFCADMLNGKVFFDKELYHSKNFVLFPSNISLTIFGRNGNEGITNLTSARVYSFTVNDSDAKAINLIPALDPSGRPCMYDTVSKQPFYNAGTGEFLYKLSGGGY